MRAKCCILFALLNFVVLAQASAQARYPSYEQLRDNAIKARIARTQRSVPNTGRFTLGSAAHEDEGEYVNMKSGVSVPEIIHNHVDDMLYDMDPEHMFERFFKCFYDGGVLPFLIDTLGTPCVCITIGFKGVKTSLQRTYRWPVQKVETGIRTPFLGRYHTEEETALQVAAVNVFQDSGGWLETRLLGANSRLQAALMNPAIAALITGGSSTPLAVPDLTKWEPTAVAQAFNAAKSMRDLPDCDDAKTTIDDAMAIIDWSGHTPCRKQGHTAFEGTERANEYHLMPDYLMREIAAHDGGIDIPGFGPLTCHHKLDSSQKWYSEFPLPNPKPFLYAREPVMSYTAPRPFNQMMNIMTADPFRCLGRNMDVGTGLSPYTTPLSKVVTARGASSPEPCMPFNHGSIVPLTATAQTRYDPVASAVGMYKSIKIAHSEYPRGFHDFDPEKDRVLWRGHQQKEECMKLFQNYLPEAGSGKYPAYDEMMQDALNQMGNVGMHWRQFTCCHSEHPTFMFGDCHAMNFE